MAEGIQKAAHPQERMCVDRGNINNDVSMLSLGNRGESVRVVGLFREIVSHYDFGIRKTFQDNIQEELV